MSLSNVLHPKHSKSTSKSRQERLLPFLLWAASKDEKTWWERRKCAAWLDFSGLSQWSSFPPPPILILPTLYSGSLVKMSSFSGMSLVGSWGNISPSTTLRPSNGFRRDTSIGPGKITLASEVVSSATALYNFVQVNERLLTSPYCKDFKTAAKAGHGSNSSCAIFYSALSAAVAHPLMPPHALELVLSPGVASSLLVPPLALLALALSPGHYLQWLLVPEKSLL